MAPIHVESATSLVRVGAEYKHQTTVVVKSISTYNSFIFLDKFLESNISVKIQRLLSIMLGIGYQVKSVLSPLQAL